MRTGFAVALLTGAFLGHAAQGLPASSAARVPLNEFLCSFGFAEPVASGDSIAARGRFTTLAMSRGIRQVSVNGLVLHLNAPVERRDGEWSIAEADAVRVLAPILRPADAAADGPFRTVILDPGHGGTDGGAIGPGGVLEKKVVLDVGRRAMHKLTRCGVATRLTRSRDTEMPLEARTDAAAAWGGDLLVSIHVNSSGNPDARGIETYVLPAPGFPATAATHVSNGAACRGNAHDTASSLLAYYVHTGLISGTRLPDRGIRRARYAILRDAPCPAILVECGFVSHRREEQAMLDWRFRDRVAEGIARGVLTMLSRTE